LILEEVLSGVRAAGMAPLSEVEAMVLQTEGTAGVVKKASGTDDTALQGLRGIPLAAH
jgi:hypothetical protein